MGNNVIFNLQYIKQIVQIIANKNVPSLLHTGLEFPVVILRPWIILNGSDDVVDDV